MKKIIVIFCILISLGNFIYATDLSILESQQKTLGISDFIDASKQYTQETFEDIDLQNIFEDAITGRIGNTNLLNSFLNILGRETKTCVSNIGIIMIVIIIHSILITISESLGNKSVSQIAYFVEYIVIITLVLSNFAEIINMVKDSIIDLVGFSNSLIPLMITLMLTTGAIVSAGVIKPVLLILMNFIGNFITNFILPLRDCFEVNSPSSSESKFTTPLIESFLVEITLNIGSALTFLADNFDLKNSFLKSYSKEPPILPLNKSLDMFLNSK